MNQLYGNDCCGSIATLSNEEPINKHIKSIKKAFDKAMDWLWRKKDFAYEDKPIKHLHQALNRTFTEAVSAGISYEVPEAMQKSFRNDLFLFSGMKTYAQLKEASQQLVDTNGVQKPFAQFAQDVLKIHKTYNINHLQAEWQKANATAQMVDKWLQWQAEPNKELYNLQIRTAGDDKVRDAHQLLNMITLPMTDPFWLTHSTPFDWNCRCLIVKVLKAKYAANISTEDAQKLSEKSINELFRYNPIQQGTIFPPKHPYYAQHCGKKLNVSRNIDIAQIVLSAEKDKCAWQKKIKEELVSQRIKSYINGGSVIQSVLVDMNSSDYQKVLKCADFFAKNGDQVEILPKINVNDPARPNFYKDLDGTAYEKKSPDMRVNGIYYEVEGFKTENLKNAFRNMMNNGFKQASRVIIEDCGMTDREIKRSIFNRKQKGATIDELWILEKKGKLRKVY